MTYKRIAAVHTVGNNSSLIASASRLYPLDGVVLDLTYGIEGGFWKVIRPAGLFWLPSSADFRATGLPDAAARHVIYDPPYVSKGGHDTSTITEMNERYGMLTEGRNPTQQWRQVIVPGLAEAARLCEPGGDVWFKLMDYVTGGKVHWFTKLALAEIERVGLRLEDEFVLVGSLGPQPLDRTRKCPRCKGTGRLRPTAALDLSCADCDGLGKIPSVQQHAARTHSVLMICRKPRGRARK